jgi:hypothetical protein
MGNFAQAESSIANAEEDSGEPFLVVREIDGSPDVVIVLAAPIVQFVAKYPGISLADEHVVMVFEAQIERFREA